MKKITAALFSVLLFTACQQEQKGPSTKPFEHFHFQRSYPLEKLDYRAYDAAMAEARNIKRLSNQSARSGDWRLEGPTNIGGRINCIEVDPTNESIIYAGSSNGGIFKTTDGGTNWNPVADDFSYMAIGDIAIDPNNSQIIYAGTGDPNISGLPHIGDGIYKSLDGGATWNHMGLTEPRIVSKIIVNPQNSNQVFAATMGIPFERNNFRGLYRSDDGGQNWQQVLFVSDESGVIDLVIDPETPSTIYAASWNRVRNNQESMAAGPDAKIFKSTDSGDNWTQLQNGLPTGNLSRIGLAISQTNSNVLYAVYVDDDYELEGLYKTIDAGANWTAVNINGVDPLLVNGFGWYFGQVRINPSNHDHISLLGVEMYTTYDGGANWERSVPEWWTYEVHADKHDMVYLPSGAVLLATDGGIYKCNQQQLGIWNRLDNIPNTQFYRVAVSPYQSETYSGGAQDNGTSEGNYQSLNAWPRIFGGDGFQPVYDSYDEYFMYCETQNGGLYYLDLWDGYAEDFTYGIDQNDRRNWDMPYFKSVHNSDRFYTGTYRVYRNDDAPYGSWYPISSDLTDGVIFGDMFHNITTVEESPVTEDKLYAGTSDGNVWRLLSSGGSWENITTGLPDHYVTNIKASPNFGSTVYVTHSGYKMNDFISHVHRSDDNGDTWIDISGDLPQTAVNHIEVLNDTALFVATDDGVYGTLNGGTNWSRIGNMPLMTVPDIEIDHAAQRLVAGTFARSIMSYPLADFLAQAPVGITDNEANYRSTYPNPANDKVFFSVGDEAVNLQIFSSSGHLVKSVKNYSNSMSVDISELGSGTYIWIAEGNQPLTGRFVKM